MFQKCGIMHAILTNQKYSFKNTNVFETGISDHHLLIYTMLKTTFSKAEPKKITYRSLENYSKVSFTKELSSAIKNTNSFESFETKAIDIVNKHAPLKTKFLRGNHKPHVSAEMRKAIMWRSKYTNPTDSDCVVIRESGTKLVG